MRIENFESYGAYTAWKGWGSSEFFRCSEYEFRYFRGEFGRHDFKGKRILEIGFGNGEFLAYARSHGAELWGTEVIADLRDLGRQHGVHVLKSDLSDVPAGMVGTFDMIVALDVFEHIDFPELITLLKKCSTLLAPDGQLVARFPNGQSPFGRFYQHGDLTHRACLSASIFEHLCTALNFDYAGASRPNNPVFGPFPKKSGRRLKQLTQKSLEWFIGRTYAIREPLSPRVVVRLNRRSKAA